MRISQANSPCKVDWPEAGLRSGLDLIQIRCEMVGAGLIQIPA